MLDIVLGVALLVALVAVIILFARVFGPRIAASAERVASGKANADDVLPALMAVGVIGSDAGASCDGGGCD